MAGVLVAEVHKVPEPANLVRRNFFKILLLAENFDQNPRVTKCKNLNVSAEQKIVCENRNNLVFKQIV